MMSAKTYKKLIIRHGKVVHTKTIKHNLEKMTRYTRADNAGIIGRVIRCPHCGGGTRVFHFSWSGLFCNGCQTMIDKYDWLVERRGTK